MILLPVVFGIIFLLVLMLKLLGGKIAWWIVVTFGVLFIGPIICLVLIGFYQKLNDRKNNIRK